MGPRSRLVGLGVDAVVKTVVLAVTNMGRLRIEASDPVHARARGWFLASDIGLASPTTLIAETNGRRT